MDKSNLLQVVFCLMVICHFSTPVASRWCVPLISISSRWYQTSQIMWISIDFVCLFVCLLVYCFFFIIIIINIILCRIFKLYYNSNASISLINHSMWFVQERKKKWEEKMRKYKSFNYKRTYFMRLWQKEWKKWEEK